MDEEQIKNSFSKIKEDIDEIVKEIGVINQELSNIKEIFSILCDEIEQIKSSTQTSTHKSKTQTFRHINQTNKPSVEVNSTHNLPLQRLKPQNLHISTGNEGVSTDRQTDRQTDEKEVKSSYNLIKPPIQDPKTLLESLDTLKKETRFKFKRLTPQEMLVFSTIYQLENEGKIVDYKLLSSKLGLSESSMRDYVNRIVLKEIPITKEKVANKQILLHIDKSLKTLASLDTIMKLREL